MLIKANKLGKTDEEFFDDFRNLTNTAMEEILASMADSEESPTTVAMELAVRSYLYKIVSEYMIDMIAEYYWKDPEKLGGDKGKDS
jgi:hypothetical protein